MVGHFDSLSAVIPVYNEERTIGTVVQTVIDAGFFGETICIDDGSKDGSRDVLLSFGTRIVLICLDENRGKGAALAQGILAASGDIVLFLDADLIGLTPDHLYAMVAPLLERRAEATLGTGRVASRFPLLTGERAYFRKDLLPLVSSMVAKRYGVEVFLNHKFQNKKRGFVYLDGLDQILKPQKMGFNITMVSSYLLEGFQISMELSRQTLNGGRERLFSFMNPGKKIMGIPNRGLKYATVVWRNRPVDIFRKISH